MRCLEICVYLYFTISYASSGEFEERNPNTDLFAALAKVAYDDIPATTGKPTVVEIDLYMNRLSDVTVSSMQYKIDIFLTQRWNDSRLMFNQSEDRFVSLPDNLLPRLWIPDLFIAQANDGQVHSIVRQSKVVKLKPRDGTMLCSQRIHADISCAMNLIYFPFDSQRCEIRLESWRYDSDILTLKWLPGSFDGDFDNKEVDKKLSLALPALSVDTSAKRKNECVDSARPGFSCLNYYIVFHRKLSFYVGDIYIPSLFMVIVTWMSFWIDRKVIQGRCALGSLTMVAISNQIGSVKSVLPPTAEVKAADVWLWTCQFYVLAAFLEFGLVNFLSRRDAKKKQLQESSEAPATQTQAGNPKTVIGSHSDHQPPSDPSDGEVIEMQEHLPADAVVEPSAVIPAIVEGEAEESGTRWAKIYLIWKKWCKLENAMKVDYFSRAFFPGSFAFFCLVYWAYYLQVSGYDPAVF